MPHHATPGNPLSRVKAVAQEFSRDIDRRVSAHLEARKALPTIACPKMRRARALELEVEREALLAQQRAITKLSEKVKAALREAVEF